MRSGDAQSNRIASPTRIPNVIARVMSWGYRLGIGFENRRYDRGVGVVRLDRAVISVGNLSAGGTGKTPMVHWMARRLIDSGKHPVIAMRGYRAGPGEMGDEEREHRIALPEARVVAQPNRIAGLEKLFASDGQVDCVILDDGFQHRQIARDVDIVLIDASVPPYRDALLPRGFLRDPVSSLERADAVVITHREMVSEAQLKELVAWVRAYVPEERIAVASHVWKTVNCFTRSDDGWVHEERTIEQIVGEKIIGVCAIGNPEGFFRQMSEAGWDVADRIMFRDHDDFGDDAMKQVVQALENADGAGVCMTRKDWVKARDRLDLRADALVVVPELGLKFDQGEEMICSLVVNGY